MSKTYEPAIMASPVEVRIDAQGIRQIDARGRSQGRVSFDAIESIRWLYFVGFLALIPILSMPISAILDRGDALDLWWLVAMLGCCVALCVGMAVHARPWRRPRSIPIGELATTLVAESPPARSKGSTRRRRGHSATGAPTLGVRPDVRC